LLFAQERYVAHWLANRLLSKLLLSLVCLVLVSTHLLLACWAQMRSLVSDDVGGDNAQTPTFVPIIWRIVVAHFGSLSIILAAVLVLLSAHLEIGGSGSLHALAAADIDGH